jgi:hypothetical protein
MTLAMKLYGREVLSHGNLAPTDATLMSEKESSFKAITNELCTVKNTQEVFIAGEFNGKVGVGNNSEVVGRPREICQNDNGVRLIYLCAQFKLRIANTFFKHKDFHKFTWERPSMNQKSIIGYIIYTNNKASIWI